MPQARGKDGAEDQEEGFDPGEQGGKGLRMGICSLHRKWSRTSETSTQTQNVDPGWAQKIRPWPGGAGHFLPTVLSGDRPAGPRPGPPRRVFRRSSPRLRNQPPPSVRGPLLQNSLLAMTAVPAPRSLVVLLQVLWLALAQIVSPVTSLALQSPVQSLGLRILESLGPVLVRP